MLYPYCIAVTTSCRFWIFLIAFFIGSCKPFIYSFNASPRVITGDETVKLDWRARGKTSMEFNEHLSVDSVQLLEFNLIATKFGNKERQQVQVQKIKPETSIEIILVTKSREGDVVVATGENNTDQWQGFQIMSVSSNSARDLMVEHSGKSATLKADGTPSTIFSATNAGGTWTFRTKLTAAEIAGSVKIPEKLKIKATIKRSK